jgi:hypothetical protein
MRSLDHGAVAGDVRRAGEHIHALGAADARHGVEREGGDRSCGQVVDQVLIEHRREPGDQRGVILQAIELGLGRGVDAEDDVTAQRVTQCRPSLDVGVIGKAGEFAGVGLDDHVVAELDQLADRVRRRRHAGLTGLCLLQYSNDHLKSSPRQPTIIGGTSGPRAATLRFCLSQVAAGCISSVGSRAAAVTR